MNALCGLVKLLVLLPSLSLSHLAITAAKALGLANACRGGVADPPDLSSFEETLQRINP